LAKDKPVMDLQALKAVPGKARPCSASELTAFAQLVAEDDFKTFDDMLPEERTLVVVKIAMNELGSKLHRGEQFDEVITTIGWIGKGPRMDKLFITFWYWTQGSYELEVSSTGVANKGLLGWSRIVQ
jgi:hypothetical protein